MESEFSAYFEKLGQRIKSLREAKGVDQKQFAFDCGVGRVVLHRIEKGQVNPKAETLLKIARELDMTLAELVGV